MINQFKAIKGQDDSNNSKQTDRTTIFHFMGKLLYNKRISPDVFIFEEEPEESSKNASIKAFEKSNNIRQMSYEELKFYDPPFYFNPVDLLRNSGLDCKLIEMYCFSSNKGSCKKTISTSTSIWWMLQQWQPCLQTSIPLKTQESLFTL